MRALYEFGPDGQVFGVDGFQNGFLIYCYPANGNNSIPKQMRHFIPTNSPTKLNDIFTRLRFIGGWHR